jgi:hypothetical protein
VGLAFGLDWGELPECPVWACGGEVLEVDGQDLAVRALLPEMDSSGRVVLADGEAIEWVWFQPGGH